MPLPQIDADPTAPARVPHAGPVTTATRVHEALAGLSATGATAAVVYRGGRPVGIVTTDRLIRARGAGRSGATVVTVMDFVAVPVDRRSDAKAPVRSIADAAWDGRRRRRTGRTRRSPGLDRGF